MNINHIKHWIVRGEDERLEFKLKANHPEKIVKEMVAFANTNGGYLIVGVSDDRKIVGVKYPEEARYMISRAVEKFCRPVIDLKSFVISTSDNRILLVYHIPKSDRLPHFIETAPHERKAYFRIGESSIQASPELCTIMQRSTNTTSTAFNYGDAEHRLMQILDREPMLTIDSYAHKAGITRKKAADILVLMVLARVVKIHPAESGDRFSMAPATASAYLS